LPSERLNFEKVQPPGKDLPGESLRQSRPLSPFGRNVETVHARHPKTNRQSVGGNNMEPVAINASWCKGCGICVAFCPRQALVLKYEKAQHIRENCIVCGMCERYCPDLAITVDTSCKPGKKSRKEIQ
jgi:2-oxoglutarate ferredoxin oxidoreductase subunit delta